ncbi:MAG: hypothetical protein JWR18_2454 [Segetibacter sp.]|nr:hypothetical protein [Segetibacter sp.]
MDTESQNIVLEVQLLKKQKIVNAINRLKLVAVLVVLGTILVAYSQPTVSTNVFISLLPFFVVQIFATREYAELGKVSRRIRLIIGGPFFPTDDTPIQWTIPAGVAIFDSYFVLLLSFDLSWLTHAYLYPSPAHSFDQFLIQLSIGALSGVFFVWFTIFLWLFYFYLFIIGMVYSKEMRLPEEINSFDVENANSTIVLKEAWVKVITFDNEELYLQAHHMHNPGKQPLILFPGFFQNGHVYDLSEDKSVARFLWQNDFDIWIVHPRGTAQSEGRKKKSSLDDFASDDIPAVISYVFEKTGIKPIFVGHSQGGISAMISLMGAVKSKDGSVLLSDEHKDERQQNLRGLVTLGSFLNFTFSKKSPLKSFVLDGLCLKMFGKNTRLLRSQSLIKIVGILNHVASPVSFKLRTAMMRNRRIRLLLFPLTLILNFISLLKIWEFLYHIPNVEKAMRKRIFYKTMDGTFSRIMRQFYFALLNDQMCSQNEKVNYSNNYQRLTLPVSVVTMEFDSLADPITSKQEMFDDISSNKKYFLCWDGLGHEDHFANEKYFPQILDAIRKVSE